GDALENCFRQPLQLTDEPIAVLADHRDVAHDDVRPQPRRERERVARVLGGRHLGPACGERDTEELEDVGVIVDDDQPEADEDALQRSGSLRRSLFAAYRPAAITGDWARTRTHVMRMMPPMWNRIGASGALIRHRRDYKLPRSTVKRYSRCR